MNRESNSLNRTPMLSLLPASPGTWSENPAGAVGHAAPARVLGCAL
jgi:hypothetical protein